MNASGRFRVRSRHEYYYLVGNRGDDQPDIHIWVSDDLITWKRHSAYVPDLKRVPDYPKALARIGAPKLFYDAASSQFLLSGIRPTTSARRTCRNLIGPANELCLPPPKIC